MYVVLSRDFEVQEVYGPFARQRSAMIAAQRMATDGYEYSIHKLSPLGLSGDFGSFRDSAASEHLAYREDWERFPKPVRIIQPDGSIT